MEKKARLSERKPGLKINQLIDEVETIIRSDEAVQNALTGGIRTYEDIVVLSAENDWHPKTISYSLDKLTVQNEMSPEDRKGLVGVYSTLERMEGVVKDWMPKIVEAVPPDREYDMLRLALEGQAREEAKHQASILRFGRIVLGLDMSDAQQDEFARLNNNFIAEKLRASFEDLLGQLLMPPVSLPNLRKSIFTYGIISEDVVANSDVIIRRAKGNFLDSFNLPGMKLAQANVRKDEGRHVRIAHLSTLDYKNEDPNADRELILISRKYMNLADKMLGSAKSRLNGGLIDHYLTKGYGENVDSLYYYMMNMKRFARRLEMLGLRDGASEIHQRMKIARDKYTDKNGDPIIREANGFMLKHGPRLVGAIASSGLIKA